MDDILNFAHSSHLTHVTCLNDDGVGLSRGYYRWVLPHKIMH